MVKQVINISVIQLQRRPRIITGLHFSFQDSVVSTLSEKMQKKMIILKGTQKGARN